MFWRDICRLALFHMWEGPQKTETYPELDHRHSPGEGKRQMKGKRKKDLCYGTEDKAIMVKFSQVSLSYCSTLRIVTWDFGNLGM